ncbi:MAG TPA: hypothetical protein VGM43_11755 [Bryobacteraceae bacterium]
MNDLIRVAAMKLNRTDQAWSVQGLGTCLGGANNGPHWVFAQVHATWRDVLYDIGQSLQRLNSSTNGWYDLELQQHSSATESVHVVYRFNGEAYQPARCFVLAYPFDNDGNVASTPTSRPCDWDWRKRVEPRQHK